MLRHREGRSPRPERIVVPAGEPLLHGEPFDYADAFAIALDEHDRPAANVFARGALAEAPAWMRIGVALVHRHVLGLRLAPASSRDHVLGWTVVAAGDDVFAITASSPRLGRALVVGRRDLVRRRLTLATYLRFTRPVSARPLWMLVGPLHRRVAPYLLRRGAATAGRDRVAVPVTG